MGWSDGRIGLTSLAMQECVWLQVTELSQEQSERLLTGQPITSSRGETLQVRPTELEAARRTSEKIRRLISQNWVILFIPIEVMKEDPTTSCRQLRASINARSENGTPRHTPRPSEVVAEKVLGTFHFQVAP
jgi:hypothetical protein